MKKEDEVFGMIEFDYSWSKMEEIVFWGKREEIVLLISGDEGGNFEEEQYKAYNMLMKKWEDICPLFLESVLEYYTDRRIELGYDEEYNERFPEITNINELLEHITLVGIKIPYQMVGNGRRVGISFDCTWDTENGLGIKLCDEEVIKVGYQDVAL